MERQRHERKVMEEVADAQEVKKVRTKAATPSVSCGARQLALVYYIERAIESGLIKDYADAAHRISVTRARLRQIVDLMGMTVEEQGRMPAIC